jgi:NAD-dependent dihydropyrimidine dehydrogenase PreA subunit
MPIPKGLKEYARQIGFPGSETLAKIFQIIYSSEDELTLVEALPGTVNELAQRTGIPVSHVKDITDNLLIKGYITVDFKRLDVLRRFPAMIELRDASVLGKDVPEELFTLWNQLVTKESAQMVEQLTEAGIPPMIRVVPIEQTVDSQNMVLDIDSARKIFRDADLISVIPCVCRMVMRKNGKGTDCPAPENSVCMQTNFFASVLLTRGFGEQITNEDALKRIGEAEDAGLVHVVRNNVQKDMFMCNCCSCCCTSLFLMQQMVYQNSMSPSRFKAKLDDQACTGCGICEDRCQLHAISVNDVASIDDNKCFGCGNCVLTCPDEALTLEEVHPKEFIRMK